MEVVLVNVVESYDCLLSLLVNLENVPDERSVMFLGKQKLQLEELKR